MSTQAHADAVSPHELARRAGRYSGEIPIAAFPRLSALVLSDGSVDVQLEFSRDDEGRSRVQGHAVVSVALSCQRCLEPVSRRLDAPIDMRVLASDAEAREFADAFDSFVSSEESVAVVDLIEDDLILALPSQVCEAYDACPNGPEVNYPVDAETTSAEPARPNPFAALAELKKRHN